MLNSIFPAKKLHTKTFLCKENESQVVATETKNVWRCSPK